MHPEQFTLSGDYLYIPLMMMAGIITFHIVYFLLKSSSYPAIFGGLLFFSLALELLSSTLLFSFDTSIYVASIIYSFSCSFLFLTIWYGFRPILKKSNSEFSYVFFYFGYLWVLVTIVVSCIFTLLKDNSFVIWNRIYNWVFIVTIWIALIIVYKKLNDNDASMITYAILNTISAIFFTIETYTHVLSRESEFLLYFLGNAPIYLSLVVSATCCSGWSKEKIDDVELTTAECIDVELANDSQITLTEFR